MAVKRGSTVAILNLLYTGIYVRIELPDYSVEVINKLGSQFQFSFLLRVCMKTTFPFVELLLIKLFVSSQQSTGPKYFNQIFAISPAFVFEFHVQ